MLGRIARTVLAPRVCKQLQAAKVLQQFRPLSYSPIFNAAKQEKDENDDFDLMFDMGKPAQKSDASHEDKKLKKRIKPEKREPLVQVKKEEKPKKEKIPAEKKDRSFEQLKYHDLALNLTYVKLPFEHPQFQSLMLMIKSRKYRSKKNLILTEGRRLTLEAIEAGLKIRYLFFSDVKYIEEVRQHVERAFIDKTEIIRVPHNDLSTWSILTTCPGLIAVFEKPTDMEPIWNNVKKAIIEKEIVRAKKAANSDEDLHDIEREQINKMANVPITIICDQIREPNNLGGIIRTCAALPCDRIILLKGCADPWDVKALRGGCGAQFRVPIVGPVEWEQVSQHLPNLNDLSVFIADNESKDEQMPRDEFEQKRKLHNAKFFKPKAYSEVPFSNCKHIALVIGGETEGVSSHALDFMHFVSQTNEQNSNADLRPNNAIIEIPLSNGVESLNASVATAILLFEMRKQLTQWISDYM